MTKRIKIIVLVAGGLIVFGVIVAVGLFYLLQEPEKTGPIVTTASGLQYIDLWDGESGWPVKRGDQIVVHYVGSFPDGRVFERSRDKDEPYTFIVGGGDVIPAWDEGVLGMKVGGKRKLLVPSKLGYGDKGKSPDIPPNTDLVFVIELLRIF